MGISLILGGSEPLPGWFGALMQWKSKLKWAFACVKEGVKACQDAKAIWAMPKCPGHQFEWGFPNEVYVADEPMHCNAISATFLKFFWLWHNFVWTCLLSYYSLLFDSDSLTDLLVSIFSAHPTLRYLIPSNYPFHGATSIHMGHFPQDGENEQNLSDFFVFEASLWPNGLIF